MGVKRAIGEARGAVFGGVSEEGFEFVAGALGEVLEHMVVVVVVGVVFGGRWGRVNGLGFRGG